MAVFSARGAPLPEGSALVAEPQSQELVQRSLTLTEKIMQDIEDTHKSCVTVKVCRTALTGWRAGKQAGWLACVRRRLEFLPPQQSSAQVPFR